MGCLPLVPQSADFIARYKFGFCLVCVCVSVHKSIAQGGWEFQSQLYGCGCHTKSESSCNLLSINSLRVNIKSRFLNIKLLIDRYKFGFRLVCVCVCRSIRLSRRVVVHFKRNFMGAGVVSTQVGINLQFVVHQSSRCFLNIKSSDSLCFLNIKSLVFDHQVCVFKHQVGAQCSRQLQFKC
jgi:hypothetical protein